VWSIEAVVVMGFVACSNPAKPFQGSVVAKAAMCLATAFATALLPDIGWPGFEHRARFHG
jgi:hypothetical protein